MGHRYYDEGYVLSEVMNDPVFSKFYQHERGKISKPLFMLEDKTIRANMSFGNLGDEVYIILMKNAVVSKEDMIHIAHELMHLILCSEGYKILEPIGATDTNVHHFINDMMHEPLLNRRLLSYGFDVAGYLSFSDNEQKRTIGINSRVPKDLLLLKTLYVKRVLDFRNLNPNVEPNEIEFNIWIKEYYPEVIPESEDLLSLINKNGFETTIQSEITTTEILKMFDFQKYFILKNL
jgi:hypothetical protein